MGREFWSFLFMSCCSARCIVNRNLPRVGGKIGARRVRWPASLTPPGFSYVDCRAITLFSRPPDAAPYANLKTYLRDAPLRRAALVRVYRVAGCNTRIEIMDEPPPFSGSMRGKRSHCSANCRIRASSIACI